MTAALAIWIGGEAFFAVVILLSLYAMTCDLLRNWRWIIDALKGKNHDDAM